LLKAREGVHEPKITTKRLRKDSLKGMGANKGTGVKKDIESRKEEG